MKENMKTRIVTLLAALLLTAASTYAQTKIATTISVKPEGGDAKPYNVAVVEGTGTYYVRNLTSAL